MLDQKLIGIYAELEKRGFGPYIKKGDDRGYLDFGELQRQLGFRCISIQGQPGFQRISAQDRAFLWLTSEIPQQAAGLYTFFSVDKAEKLCAHGWTLTTDFSVKGTGIHPVWPKSPKDGAQRRTIAHRRLEDEQKKNVELDKSLPAATRLFIDFWVEAQAKGWIHQYADDDQFKALIEDLGRVGIIDDADIAHLEDLKREREAKGEGPYKALNPCPYLGLGFELPALILEGDATAAVDVIENELRFLFDTLGFKLEDFLGEHMNDQKQSTSEDDVFVKECIDLLLNHKPQIILQGPPGTGKTFLARKIAEKILKEPLEGSKRYKLVQFHSSYTYEDFVRGIQVKTDKNGNMRYEVTNRVFAQFAQDAQKNPDQEAHVLIIDEINRANLSAVLGELIYALEYRDEAVASMYALQPQGSDDLNDESEGLNGTVECPELKLPKNLYIIGTMNTADRSAGHIDYAIRRRFAFREVLPECLKDEEGFDKDLFERVRGLFTGDEKYETRSEHLSEEFRPKDVTLGHYYFLGLKEDGKRKLRVEYEIKPILFEYVKDGVLKESALDIIKDLK